MRGERSLPRMTYLEGVVELMSRSRHHEIDKTGLARLIHLGSDMSDAPPRSPHSQP